MYIITICEEGSSHYTLLVFMLYGPQYRFPNFYHFVKPNTFRYILLGPALATISLRVVELYIHFVTTLQNLSGFHTKK
jgi:hypothetical protein